jgi:flagellin
LRNADGFTVNVTHPGGVDISGMLNYFDQVMNVLSYERAHVGAQETRLNHIMNTLTVQELNMSDANSRITDADMFREQMRFMRATMRHEVGVMMLAQAHQMQMTISHVLLNNLEQSQFTVGSPSSREDNVDNDDED